MRRIRVILHRFRSLFWRGRQEAELRREMELHLEQLRKEISASGMSQADANRELHRQFGSIDLVKEECRDTRRVRLLEDTLRDIGFSLRLFRKSPGFTLTAVVTLILGIGANAAMFQLFEVIRLRTLPVQRPEELVSIRIRGDGRAGNFRGRNSEFTYPVWDEIRRHQTAFTGILAYGDTPLNLSPAGELKNVEGLWVSGSFFETLGVHPHLGRLLSREDDHPGCGWPGVVISHAFWQREFGGDAAVLSRTLPIDGQSVSILGVTPREFFGVEIGRRFDVAMPICSAPEANLKNRMFWFLSVMARLKPDLPAQTARAHLMAISPAVFEATIPPYQPQVQAQYAKLQLDLEPGPAGQSGFRDSFQTPLNFLLCMVALVLLLACANLANMMLARATAREHEFAVRRSLGASGERLMRQVLMESLLLAVAGAVLGVLAAAPIGRGIVAMLSTERDPLYLALGMNWRVLTFTAATTIVATVLFGLAPAIRAGRTDTRGASASGEKLALRRLLLVGQVSLSMVLLTTALLFSRSFQNLLTFSPGFDPQGILVASVFLDLQKPPPEQRAAFIEDLHHRIQSIPAVSAVARSFVIPISGSGWDRGGRATPAGAPQEVNLTSISEGYFRLMKIPLLAGRDFDANDRPASTPVAIVNQALARKFFAGGNPVGKYFYLDALDQSEPPFRIVGLTGDAKYSALSEEFAPILYLPASQEKSPRTTVRFLVRARGTAESQIRSIRQVILDADPRLTMRFVVLQSQIEESVLRERLLAALTSAFGVLGTILALTGIFGVTTFVVSLRYREFGVRIALGATGSRIVRLILVDVALVLVCGIVAGGLLAVAAGTAASAILYGIEPHDPLTLVAVTLLLGIGGLAAGAIPALRAARVAPVEALRVE